jgi:hypothetical protein
VVIVAVDPGVGSSAVAIWSEGEVVAACSIRRRKRARSTVYEVADASISWTPIAESSDPELAYLGAMRSVLAPGIARCPTALVVEGLFGGGPALDRLSWSAGIVTAVAASTRDVVRVLRPQWSQWHRTELGSAARAHEATWAAYLRAVPCRPEVRRWLLDEPLVDGDRHARDAVAMGRWAAIALTLEVA